MRVIYKKPIIERLYEEIHYAKQTNRTIEYIYLADSEWYELINTIRHEHMTGYYPYPKRVVIHEPIRMVNEYDIKKWNKPVYQTEEIEFMGHKIRKEYL